jgi:putative transposon-encoded protein
MCGKILTKTKSNQMTKVTGTAKVIAEIETSLERVMKKYGRSTLVSAAEVVRLEGINNLIQTGLFLGLAPIFAAVGSWAQTAPQMEFLNVIGCWILYAISALIAVVSVFVLADVWTWAAIFSPKTYIANEVYNKVFGDD